MNNGDGESTTEDYGPRIEPPSSYRPVYVICKRGETWWGLHRTRPIKQTSRGPMMLPMPVGPFVSLEGLLDRIRDLHSAELAAED